MLNWNLYPAREFEHWSSAWDELNRSRSGSALLEARFVAILVHFFANDSIQLAIGQRHGTIIAMALIEPGGRGTWSTFQPGQAPLGLWLTAPNLDQGEAGRSLMEALSWSTLIFGILQQDPCIMARPALSPQLRTLDHIRTARVPTTGRFEDYWASRGKNLRHNLKRQRNRLEREGISLRFDVAREPEQMVGVIADYGRLESQGWKNTTGTAVSADNVQGAFYRALLETYAETGDAFAYRYYYNDRVAACDFCIIGHGVINWLKTTYDENETTSSPAALLRQEAFEHVFADPRIRVIEFYGPVMDWHTKWADEIRTMYHINLYRWSWLAKLHGHKHQAPAGSDSGASQALPKESD